MNAATANEENAYIHFMCGFCKSNASAAVQEYWQQLHFFYLQRPYRVIQFIMS
jgi:hypothetical protein